MEQTITIYYKGKTGKMTIQLDKFFPCTQKDLKKLVKLMLMDWNNPDQLISDCFCFCEEKRLMMMGRRDLAANDYTHCRTLRVECECRIRDKKKTNGVPFTDDELKAEKVHLQSLKEEERRYQNEFNLLCKQIPKLKKNIEFLDEYRLWR